MFDALLRRSLNFPCHGLIRRAALEGCFHMTEAAETHKFEAEVAQVLHLVTHSLYSHKEIFLRELISNASDACDKLRFESIAKPELLAGDGELHIDVS